MSLQTQVIVPEPPAAVRPSPIVTVGLLFVSEVYPSVVHSEVVYLVSDN